MASNSDSPECYVCAESSPPPRLSQCACKGRYVHDECLHKLLIMQPQAICMVCRQPHADVIVREPEEVLERLKARRQRIANVVASCAVCLSTIAVTTTLVLLLA